VADQLLHKRKEREMEEPKKLIRELADGDVFVPYQVFAGKESRRHPRSFILNTVMRRTDLSPIAKLLWGRLSQFAGRNGQCYPTQYTLALELGCVPRTILRALKELEDAGLIRRKSPSGRARLERATTRYEFIWSTDLVDPLASQTRPRSARKHT
jgi:hypothetical protein